MSLGADLTACADLVRRGDPDRFLAVMAAPAASRGPLFALYAMNVEISRAPWVTAEPMIAEMRLQWWRDALAEIADGRPVRAHEVTNPLSRVLSPGLAAGLDACIAARRRDIQTVPFADGAELDGYLADSAGTLLWTAARSLGEAEESVVREIGWASGLASWFRAVPELVARGRKPLPDSSPAAIRALAEDGLDRLSRARARRRSVSVAAAPALYAAWMAGPVLARARRDPARVAGGRLVSSEAGKRARLLYTAATGLW